MADLINGVSSIKPMEIVKRGPDSPREKVEEATSSTATDRVEISKEALALAEAEKAAADVRAAVEANPEASLGLDPNFDTNA